jgi:aconitate hydratase
MGQAPPTNKISLRTFSRNFPGRSGNQGDLVYLCSPEVAAASAITGVITDPRELGDYPSFTLPDTYLPGDERIEAPLPEAESANVEIVRGPNIAAFPDFAPLPETWKGKVVLKLADNVTTDHIMPAGAKILPLRSNIPAISEYVFSQITDCFACNMKETMAAGYAGAVIGGDNYGQGSSREHAALAPRYLGVQVKLVKSFARIHKANLINFGIVPLTFADPDDYERAEQGDEIVIKGLREAVLSGAEQITMEIGGRTVQARCELSTRHREIIAAGGLLNWAR